MKGLACKKSSLQPSRLPRPRDSPGESTGVGRHRLLRSRGLGSSSSKAKMLIDFPTLCEPKAAAVYMGCARGLQTSGGQLLVGTVEGIPNVCPQGHAPIFLQRM